MTRGNGLEKQPLVTIEQRRRPLLQKHEHDLAARMYQVLQYVHVFSSILELRTYTCTYTCTRVMYQLQCDTQHYLAGGQILVLPYGIAILQY
jgi:hypothetical protein